MVTMTKATQNRMAKMMKNLTMRKSLPLAGRFLKLVLQLKCKVQEQLGYNMLGFELRLDPNRKLHVEEDEHSNEHDADVLQTYRHPSDRINNLKDSLTTASTRPSN